MAQHHRAPLGPESGPSEAVLMTHLGIDKVTGAVHLTISDALEWHADSPSLTARWIVVTRMTMAEPLFTQPPNCPLPLSTP